MSGQIGGVQADVRKEGWCWERCLGGLHIKEPNIRGGAVLAVGCPQGTGCR